MNYPSASQLLTSDTLKFTNTDGSPMRIFAEAGEIQDRPMLMRRLKKYGATICHEPREAQIILVDPSTISGRRFIRDWGQDSNKVVLSSTWVRRSIEAGYPLLANERWGNCLAVDDGMPIGAEDEEEDNVPNSLPTPRTTPVDLQNASSSLASRVQSQALESTPPVPPSFQISFDQMAQAAALQHSLNLPTSVVPGAQGQPAASIPGTMPFMPTPFNMGMNFSGAMLPPQAQQAMLFSMLNGSFGAAIAQNFNIALQDVLSRTPTEPHPTFNSPNSNINQSAFSLPNDQDVEGPSEGRASSKRSRSIVDSPSPPPQPTTQNRKGKQREVSPTTKPKPQLFLSPSGESYTFYVQIEIPQRQELVNNIKKNGGKLEQNHELADYIILHKRTAVSKSSKTLVQSIHAAGKMALSSRFVRDCIDKNTMVNEAAYELETPHIRKKRKVNVSPVQKKEEEAIDSEVERTRKREEQKLARSRRRAERKQHEEEEKRAEALSIPHPDIKSTSERDGDVISKPKGQNASATNTSSSNYPTPPTPPPQHTRVSMARGFRFCDVEDEYALKCAKLLIDHDHTISTSAICSYIHKTLDHHTLRSWITHFATLQPDKVNQWRKTSAVKFRKAQANASHQAANSEPSEPQPMFASPIPMSEGREPSPPATTHTPTFSAEDVDRHMNVVAKFFADGNDDDQAVPPSVLWERLANQVPERDGAGWEEFYNANFQDITERYNTLVDS